MLMSHRGDAPVGWPPGHRWPTIGLLDWLVDAGQHLPQPPVAGVEV